MDGKSVFPSEVKSSVEADASRDTALDNVRPILPREAHDPSQVYFWTDEWQEKIRAAEESVAAGRVTRSLDDGDFLQSLAALRDDDANGRRQRMMPTDDANV